MDQDASMNRANFMTDFDRLKMNIKQAEDPVFGPGFRWAWLVYSSTVPYTGISIQRHCNRKLP